jgi:hypothetical protein
MPSGKELIRINSIAHLLNQLAAGTLAGQPNAAGTQAAQNVAAAEEGIQGGLAQGKQKAMEEEAKKQRKKGLLKQVVSSIVGTAASAIPVVGPIVGPMAGEAAGSLATGQDVDLGQMAAAGLGGVGGTVQQATQTKPQQGPIVSTDAVNAGTASYDPTTGGFVNNTPQQVPAAPGSTAQSPTTPPTQPAPTGVPAPAPPAAPDPAQQQAIQSAGEVVQAPQLTPMPQAPALPQMPAAPQTAPENPNSPPPMGLGQRIAHALVSPTGRSVTQSVQQFLSANRGDTKPPTVYAPGLNPQTSMAIDQEFARRAEADAARQIQEEQLGLQREGLGLDKDKMTLERERLAQEKAANQAMQTLEQGRLQISAYSAQTSAVAAENQNKTSLYNTEVDRQTSKDQMATQERIANAGNETQLKAAGISAGASMAAARYSAEAAQGQQARQQEFQASLANMQSQKVSITPEGKMIVSGAHIDPKTMQTDFKVEEVPGQTPEVQAMLRQIQADERANANADKIVAMAFNASKDSMGMIDSTKVPENLATAMRAFGIAAMPPGTVPQTPADKPAPGPSKAAAATEANDAKLKALRTGQATTPAMEKAKPTKKEEDPSTTLLLDSILRSKTLSPEERRLLEEDLVKPNR